MDDTIDVSFPSILEQDVAEVVAAIKSASELDGFPAEKAVQLALLALPGVDDVDELMDEVREELEAAAAAPRPDPTGDALAVAVESLVEAVARG